MDYFGSKSPKSPSAVGSSFRPPCLRRLGSPQTPAEVKWVENVQTLLPLNISGWCGCFSTLGQKETYILFFLPPPPLFKKAPAPLLPAHGNIFLYPLTFNLIQKRLEKTFLKIFLLRAWDLPSLSEPLVLCPLTSMGPFLFLLQLQLLYLFWFLH